MKTHLGKRERKIIQSFAEIIIPLSSKEKPDQMKELLERIDMHIRCMKFETVFLCKMCLWLVELSAFFYYGSLKTMSKMDLPLREQYINAWHNTWWSVKRTIKRLLEATIYVNYYSIPQVTEDICGYKPVFHQPAVFDQEPLPNLHTEFYKTDIIENVDVCVIGSGAGGAVVAKELAEKGHSVIILEQGGYFASKDFGKDAMTMTNLLYQGGGFTNTLGWPPIIVPVGECVGGTTLINSGTCFRTPDTVFNRWVHEFGLHTWKPDQMKKHFDAVENVVHVDCAKKDVQGKSYDMFLNGIQKLGHNIEPLFRNAPNCCGSGVCCFGCPTNAKESVQLNYIPLALKAGAKLYTKCRVNKIAYNRRHANKVLGQFVDHRNRKKGGSLQVNAKIIVCACGSLNTPVLLKQSSIPNPSGQIGHNLTLHPAAKVMALFDDDVMGWKGVPQGAYSDALIDEGIKLEGIFLQPAFIASSLMVTGEEHKRVMERYNKIAMFGMMISDTSRGTVYKSPFGQAIPVYNINRFDLPKYRRGIQFLADAFLSAGANEVYLPLHTLPKITRFDGIRPIIELKLRNKDLDLQAFHPLGTCRMGADPRESVIDPFGRLYGLDNLFVADGSIFPTSLGVNPMITIMAAAHKIAGNIHREFL
ncbi:MAG: hypothetical protein COS89_08125 [Deltaproteobacteria bacterium CG07_land_8_20_14_0_80_38_7]|nr:MAG: hypothetical protein COS89_08125 [Deltaproteobacteria bacterium CG07_land_8_20_14_0_80_38_7]